MLVYILAFVVYTSNGFVDFEPTEHVFTSYDSCESYALDMIDDLFSDDTPSVVRFSCTPHEL